MASSPGSLSDLDIAVSGALEPQKCLLCGPQGGAGQGVPGRQDKDVLPSDKGLGAKPRPTGCPRASWVKGSRAGLRAVTLAPSTRAFDVCRLGTSTAAEGCHPHVPAAPASSWSVTLGLRLGWGIVLGGDGQIRSAPDRGHPGNSWPRGQLCHPNEVSHKSPRSFQMF